MLRAGVAAEITCGDAAGTKVQALRRARQGSRPSAGEGPPDRQGTVSIGESALCRLVNIYTEGMDGSCAAFRRCIFERCVVPPLTEAQRGRCIIR